MKAAKMTEHPSFRLMRQTDVQNVWYMQMPRWFLIDVLNQKSMPIRTMRSGSFWRRRLLKNFFRNRF